MRNGAVRESKHERRGYIDKLRIINETPVFP